MSSVKQRPPKKRLDLNSEVFPLSVAKTYLGRLVEKASRGEPVYIAACDSRFLLQEVPRIDPIPMRPEGYFTSCYTPDVIAEDNAMAKASVVRLPRDLE